MGINRGSTDVLTCIECGSKRQALTESIRSKPCPHCGGRMSGDMEPVRHGAVGDLANDPEANFAMFGVEEAGGR